MTETKAAVQAQFGATADAYVRSATHAGGADLQRMAALAAEVPRRHHALDVATGGGHTARALAPLVDIVIASDLTHPMLLRARGAFTSWGLANVVMARADAEALPFAGATFDLVSCRIAPHHFPSPGRFVAEAARVLRPGGRFLLIDSVVPDEPELGAFLNEVEAVRDPSHHRSLSRQEWLEIVGQAGLVAGGCEFYPKRHLLADWLARAKAPPKAQAEVQYRFANASPAATAAFAIEREDGQAVAYTDQKILIWADKSDG